MNAAEIQQGLARHGYMADDATGLVLQFSALLQKPLLVEGPAGVGKTGLAKAWSQLLGWELLRLQCYEGIDEAKALYEWNYQKQLLYIQAQDPDQRKWDRAQHDIYGPEFLLERPLLKAISGQQPSVLLIDEVDKSDEEFESFLLEVLSEWQVSIPETGTIAATTIPSVILTSNNTRTLSQALRRRCLYLYLDYPSEAREWAILRLHFPGLAEHLGRQVVAFVRRLRLEKLKKHPSISEVIDWTRILEELGATALTPELAQATLNVLLKHHEDGQRMSEKIAQAEWFRGLSHP